MLSSDYRALCSVNLPYRGRQQYMHSFDLAAPVMAPICAWFDRHVPAETRR